MSLVVLLVALLSSVVWGLFGGGLRQSELNVGRSEALIGALLALDQLEQDVRSMCLTAKDWNGLREATVTKLADVLKIVRGPSTQRLELTVCRDPQDRRSSALASAEAVVWTLSEPTTVGWSWLLRNGKPVKGVRLKALVFVPRTVPDGRVCLLQTFVKSVDTTGRHHLTLMGLTRLRAVLDAANAPYWNPIPDTSYLRGLEAP